MHADTSPDSSDGPAPVDAGRPGDRQWLHHAGFGALYLLALLVGPLTYPAGTQTALIWPGAPVLFLGMHWARRPGRGRRVLLLDSAIVETVTAGVLVVRGMPVPLALIIALTSLVHPLVASLVARRMGWDASGLRRQRDLVCLLAASTAGAAASAVPGTILVHLSHGRPITETFLTWVLRLGMSTFLLGTLWLCRRDEAGAQGRRAGHRAGAGERAGLLAALGLGCYVVFVAPTGAPLQYLLIAVCVWAGLRLPTHVAVRHAGVVAAVALTSGWAGWGGYTGEGPELRTVLAQSFVVIATFLTLALALHRDERATLVTRLEGAAAATADQAALLHAVTERSSDAIVVLDPQGRPVLQNPTARSLLGPGIPWDSWEIVEDDGMPHEEMDSVTKRALRGEPVPAFESRLRHRRDGREMVLSGWCQPLPRAQAVWGGGAVMTYRDITAQRHAADRVAASHEHLTGILASVTEQAIIGLTPDGEITFFNHGAERLTGHPAASMPGSPVTALFDEEELAARAAALDVPLGSAALTHVASTQRHETRPWTVHRADGTPRSVQLTTTAVRSGAGISGYLLLGTDITERLATEARLADSEQLFRLSFEAAPVAMMMVDLAPGAEGRIRRVNDYAAAFTGYPEAELLTMRAPDLLHADEQETVAQRLGEFLTG